MGLRSQIKSKIKEGLKNIKSLAFLIHDEASHPGRPQPHMAARNPMWGGEDSPPEEPPIEHELPEERMAPDGGEFWFLKGDAEGWHETNPGLKPEQD